MAGQSVKSFLVTLCSRNLSTTAGLLYPMRQEAESSLEVKSANIDVRHLLDAYHCLSMQHRSISVELLGQDAQELQPQA